MSRVTRAGFIAKTFIALCLLNAPGSQLAAYEFILIDGVAIPWAGNTATMRAAWNTQYDDAFKSALDDWNNQSKFEFKTVSGVFVDPCLEDGISTYSFSDNYCGNTWNQGILAITTSRFILAPAQTAEADIVYNSSEFTWGIHDDATNGDIDFRRVTVHEAGHVLGLAHSLSSSAIMAPTYSPTTLSLKTDDINGLIALYGDLPPSTGALSATFLLLLNDP